MLRFLECIEVLEGLMYVQSMRVEQFCLRYYENEVMHFGVLLFGLTLVWSNWIFEWCWSN